MPTTTQRIIELLQPYLPDEYKGLSHEVLEDDQPLLFNIIIYLLTHTSEGKQCKDGDVPCVLGGIYTYELNIIGEFIEQNSYEGSITTTLTNEKNIILKLLEEDGEDAEELYNETIKDGCRFDLRLLYTKAQAFLSYENLQLATTDFEAFMEKFLGELTRELERV